jgi:hypothetical protein
MRLEDPFRVGEAPHPGCAPTGSGIPPAELPRHRDGRSAGPAACRDAELRNTQRGIGHISFSVGTARGHVDEETTT